MIEPILVINADRSSIKFQLFSVDPGDRLERRLKGQIEGIGTRPRLIAVSTRREILADETWPVEEVADIPAALDRLVAFLRQQIGGHLPAAIGHRVAHGGPDNSAPVVLNARVVAQLERLVPLAPQEQTDTLAPIRAVLERRPNLLQVACFDTAFHRSHSELADRFAIPEQLYAEGIRRYGFHGLSYEYIAMQLAKVAPDIANGRVAVAHLGKSASMCAMVDGRSVESTMGFLPLATCPGHLDPGVVLHLILQKGMAPEAVEEMLRHDCGLKGLSGLSNDVSTLLGSHDPRAKLALDYFCHRIALATGSLVAAMGGLDAFVFTAGIGENAPAIREAVARRLEWFGLDLAVQANKRNESCISRKGSKVPCFVIPTDEDLMIATHTLRLMRAHELEEKPA